MFENVSVFVSSPSLRPTSELKLMAQGPSQEIHTAYHSWKLSTYWLGVRCVMVVIVHKQTNMASQSSTSSSRLVFWRWHKPLLENWGGWRHKPFWSPKTRSYCSTEAGSKHGPQLGGQDKPDSYRGFEHIELPAKLLDYFLRSNKSNINRWSHCNKRGPKILSRGTPLPAQNQSDCWPALVVKPPWWLRATKPHSLPRGRDELDAYGNSEIECSLHFKIRNLFFLGPTCCLFPKQASDLIWFAFITGISSLEPLIEGLCAQIHVNLRWRVFGRNRTGDLTDY